MNILKSNVRRRCKEKEESPREVEIEERIVGIYKVERGMEGEREKSPR